MELSWKELMLEFLLKNRPLLKDSCVLGERQLDPDYGFIHFMECRGLVCYSNRFLQQTSTSKLAAFLC